jgi:hypothetical protein
VAFVIGRLASPGGRERLTGATSCPNRSIVGPPGKSECEGPTSNAGEEMALTITPEVGGSHVGNASLVNVALGDVSGVDEVSEPLRGIRINLVVVGAHAAAL